MKVKKLLKGDKARQKIKQGIDLVADYIKVTLGPKGRNVAFNELGPLPTRIINDGVTIADKIRDDHDAFVQSGVEMVQEICKKTNFNAGDGTTQTALLAQAIINEGQKRLIAGLNPMDIKKELEDDLKQLLEKLKNKSQKVESIADVRHIATIAGNNDDEIGNAVADVMEKVGMKASIHIDKGHGDSKIRVETIEGMWFDKGWRHQLLINDPRMVTEHLEPSIFIIDEELKWTDDILPFFHKIEEQRLGKIIIIANEIEGDVLASLCATNRIKVEEKKGINVCAVESPFGGEDRKDVLEDIAIYTGATVIGRRIGKIINEVDPKEVMGSCDRIVVSSKNTTIMGGKGKAGKITARIAEIKELIAQLGPNEKTIKENLEIRRDSIESGVGIIYAGGSTEIEIKDRLYRLEDAKLASKSAIKEGYVAGGGVTYLSLSQFAQTDILKKALQYPIKQIAENAGKIPEMIVKTCLDAWRKKKPMTYGYNARTDTYEDLIKGGVLDATLVLQQSLKNAVSLAGLFLTTEAIIAEAVEDEKDKDFRGPRNKPDEY